MLVTASIVLYNNDVKVLSDAIKSFLNSNFPYKKHLYLIDNSPNETLKQLVSISPENITYIFNPTNPGFGAAHNIAIKSVEKLGAQYHLVLNPDVYFDPEVMSSIIKYMDENPSIGMIMPQILNEDGTIQNLPKLLPSPFSVLMRKIKKPHCIYKKFINRYELRFVNKNITYNAPVLSGCFTLLRISAVKEIGKYDDRFFMYFEDWDLSRRMHQKFKTVYYPEVSVIHGYESGANKNKRLFRIFINSAINYFNKWGWFFDKERKKMNQETLNQFK